MNNKPYFLALNHIPFVGPRTILKLLTHWPQLSACFQLSAQQLQTAGLSARLAEAISHFNWKNLDPDFAFEQVPHQTLLTWEDAAYPALLKEIHDPPPVLYAKGELSCLKQTMLAVVGTRKPSFTGRETAYQWAKELSKHDLTLVSGLAQGIDAAVHEGCLNASGKTIAVLGSGIQRIYPKHHQKLSCQIAEQGLLLSEFPLNMGPNAGHFPRRNRIISGLSIATLVVEAALKSGSLITARFALEQNRTVLALPGSVHLPQASGCHHLLKQGAGLVTSYQDVLEELGQPSRVGKAQACPPLNASAIPDQVLACIGAEPTTVDQIVTQTGLTLTEVTSKLTMLEIDGLIHGEYGRYVRCFY